MLADLLTIREHFGDLAGRKLVYMGDARYNMGNSLMIACAKMGMHFVACAPEKYFPDQALVKECRKFAEESGATITLTKDVSAGTKDADIIYTDVSVSYTHLDVYKRQVLADGRTTASCYQAAADALAGANPIGEALYFGNGDYGQLIGNHWFH